jgi:alpha-glucosidase (family GH31 glycosyl hydrolase)
LGGRGLHGPVKQFVTEKLDQPYSVDVYPGTDASFLLYEDDGVSFNYRTGEWTGIQMDWRAVDRREQSTSMASKSKLNFRKDTSRKNSSIIDNRSHTSVRSSS